MAGYRKQVVSFLDIMGFRQIVKDQTADQIVTMLDRIQVTAATTSEANSQSTSIISFSDSVIRARPIGSDAIEALVHEIGELAAAQWALMNGGILIRGGVTIGSVLMGPGRAFGPAFVRAYELESAWAGSPRIVIDPETITLVREKIRAAETLTARRALIKRTRQAVRFDGDGIWFVDYIAHAAISLDKEEHLQLMKSHRNKIISKANALPTGSSVLPKYLWLIRYFNASSKEIHKDDNSLKIKRSDVPRFDDLLMPPSIKIAKAPKAKSS